MNSKASTVKHSYKIFSELVAGYYFENEIKEKEILKNWIEFEVEENLRETQLSVVVILMRKKEFM